MTTPEWVTGKGATFTLDGQEWDRIFVALGDTMERRVFQYSTDIAWRGTEGTFTVNVTDPKLYAAIQGIGTTAA